MDIKIDTGYDPGTSDAIITVRYRIPAIALIMQRKPPKLALLEVFRQMQLAAFDFMKMLVMSEKGFHHTRHEQKFDESRMLTGGEIVLEGEIVE